APQLILRPRCTFTPFPYPTLFRSLFGLALLLAIVTGLVIHWRNLPSQLLRFRAGRAAKIVWTGAHKVLGTVGLSFLLIFGFTGRSEEHTSELQSRENLVCRLLLEK